MEVCTWRYEHGGMCKDQYAGRYMYEGMCMEVRKYVSGGIRYVHAYVTKDLARGH